MTESSKQPVQGRSPWMWRLLATAVLLHAAIMAVRPMSTYRALALGGDVSTVGLVAAAFAAISFVAAIPIGRAIDRGFARRWIIVGSVIVAIAASLAAVSDSIAVLALAQSLLGLGQVVVIIGSQTLLTDRTPVERRASAFGHYTFSVSLGLFLGPTVGSFFVAAAFHGGGPGDTIPNGITSMVFLMSVGAAVAGLLMALSIPAEGAAKKARVRPSSPLVGPLLSMVAIPGMRGALASSLAILTANDLAIAYLPAFGTLEGLPVAFVGLMLSAMTASSMLSRLSLGVIVGRFGPGFALAAAVWVTAVSLLLFPFADAAPLRVLLIAAAGLGFGVGQPITLLAVASLAPVNVRSSALAMRLAGNRFGQFGAPLAAGWVAGTASVDAIFWIMAGALAAAGISVSNVGALTRAMRSADADQIAQAEPD